MGEAKQYQFHYDLIHISSIHYNDDDWYGDFPVVLTDDEYNELLDVHKKWLKSEEWYKYKEQDDEFFLHRFLPHIQKKVRAALKDFAQQNWKQEIIDGLDQADIFLPGEVYYNSDPEFFEDAQSY